MSDSGQEPGTVAASGAIELGSFRVHRLGFGTMQLPGRGVWGPPKRRDAALAVLRRAVELGVDLIDTADSYGPNVAEELVREALHPYPAHLKIATKAGMTRSGPNQWGVCGEPGYLRRQCESSLRRLGMDRLDLFQLHRIDPHVPDSDQFGVLRELREEGKVAEVGLSEVTVDQLTAARAVVPIVSVQNQYNLGHRTSDALLDRCEELGIAFIPWFPLGSGKLARRGGPLDRIGRQLGATPAQVALAWLLRRSPVMLPIPGTSSLEHCEQNCAAGQIVLDDAQYSALNKTRRALRRMSFR